MAEQIALGISAARLPEQRTLAGGFHPSATQASPMVWHKVITARVIVQPRSPSMARTKLRSIFTLSSGSVGHSQG
jgi:hypothetical protein